MMANERKSWYVTGGIIALSLVLSFIGYHLPVSDTATRPLADHWRMALAVLLASFWFAAAIQFLISVKVFKAGLRRAYQIFAIAMMLVSFSYMQFPIYGMLNEWGSWWVNGGGAMLPFIVGAAMMYAGIRRFGLLLHLTGFLVSFKRVAITAVLVAVAFYASAYNFALPELDGTAEYIAVVACVGAFVFFMFMTTRKIAQVIGEEYKPAMLRLELALFVLLLACFQDVTTSHFVSYGYAFIDYGIFMWPFILAGLLLLLAARAFSQVGALSSPVSEATSDKAELIKDRDYIDSIIALSRLASQPKEIDPILDDMRTVTISLKPAEGLSEAHKKALLKVYSRIEDYLISNDPLRSYSRQELRERTQPAFRALLEG